MNKQTFILAYSTSLVACVALTIGIVHLLSPGFKVFFLGFTRDQDTALFFVKLLKVILILCGFAGALNNGYTIKDSNWLTLSWDMTDQLEATINNLWPALL